MFTGIIEAVAQVRDVQKKGIVLERPALFDDLALGSSVCVSGVCLSIIELTEQQMHFNVVQETRARTTLGALRTGDRVNLERALRADARLEGHIVQGHIDGVGAVVECEEGRLTLRVDTELQEQIVAKGSLAVDGVSLTVATVNDSTVSVALIPHTCAHTTLGCLKTGDHVNLEADVLGKYMRMYAKQYAKNP